MEVDGAAAAPPPPLQRAPAWVLQHSMRAVMGGLLSADPAIRKEFVAVVYGLQSDSRGQPAGQRLTHALIKLEYDSLAPRYWVVVVLDALLAGLRGSADAPAEDTETADGDKAPSPRVDPEEALAVHPPVSRMALGTSADDVRRQEATEKHGLLMKRLHRARRGLGRALLEPLRALMHADLSLATALARPLLAAAWATLDKDHQVRACVRLEGGVGDAVLGVVMLVVINPASRSSPHEHAEGPASS
jgi:hypothetical protein